MVFNEILLVMDGESAVATPFSPCCCERQTPVSPVPFRADSKIFKSELLFKTS